MSERSSFNEVVKWIILVVLAVLALKVVLATVGIGLALIFTVGGILFKLLPLILLVWAVVWVVQWLRGRNGRGGGSPTTESTGL